MGHKNEYEDDNLEEKTVQRKTWQDGGDNNGNDGNNNNGSDPLGIDPNADGLNIAQKKDAKTPGLSEDKQQGINASQNSSEMQKGLQNMLPTNDSSDSSNLQKQSSNLSSVIQKWQKEDNGEEKDPIQMQEVETVEETDTTAGEQTWEETGNLRGNHPVRNRTNPPNKSVIEDQEVYNQRLAMAKSMVQTQIARAEGFLDSAGKVTDYRYWFSKVYSEVTKNEIAFVEANTYYYPSFVLASVAYFEQIYADNTAAFDSGGKVEEHWLQAFKHGIDEKRDADVLRAITALSPEGGIKKLAQLASIIDLVEGAADTLVSSMQAHIRFDLPRAEAWVFNQYYAQMPGVTIADFGMDFRSMSGVFENSAETMNKDMALRLGLPVDLVPRILQDTAMSVYFDANMGTERADTWQRAEDLVNEDKEGTSPYTNNSDNTGLEGDVTSSDNLSNIGNLDNKDLRPTMESSASELDDDQARAELSNMTPDQIDKIPVSRKVRLIRAMITGSCTNDDEQQIIRLLKHSKQRVTVIDGCNAWDIVYKIHGDEYDQLRGLLRTQYYPLTTQNEAFRLVTQCIDGETSEWEEEMVADILEDRTDWRTLVSRVGERYNKSGFDTILGQLDWQEDSRMRELFDM